MTGLRTPLCERLRIEIPIVQAPIGSAVAPHLAAECGVDIIVAQGWEAGGYVRGTTTTMVLVPAVVDAVAPVPVMAAGGIGDGRDVTAALILGAQPSSQAALQERTIA